MKKIYFILASLALITVSCTTDDASQEAALRSPGNIVGFMASTTRADVATLATLEGDAAGFNVFATNGTSPGGWHPVIDGTNNYIYDTTDGWGWGSTTAPKWSTNDADYPMKFYAYYVSNPANVSVASGVSGNVGKVDITYTATDDKQSDLLTATSTAVVRPAGDKVPLTFKHALAKVGFGFIEGDDADVYVQAIGFNNLSDSRTYKVADQAFATGQSTANVSFTYLPLSKPAKTVENTDGTLFDTALPADHAAINKPLILLPQTTLSMKVVDSKADIKDAHIYMTYRLEQGADVNAIGYKDASQHPDYVEAVHGTKYNGQPLFVKVVYPVATGNLVWESGKAYTYKMNMGTANATNGYLADEYYYDKDGNKTDFEVENKDEGDQMRDGCINFIVDVEDWGAETSQPIE